MKKDDYAVILDFLPKGYAGSRRLEPIAQAVTTEQFTLLELRPKPGVTLKIGEKVFIGKEGRDKIDRVIGRINYRKLTATAQTELPKVIEKIVEEEEQRFIDFYNKAESITIREHQLDLLPGLGKKSLWEFLEERKKKLFESYADIKARVPSFPDPKKLIVKRILQELQEPQKRYLFVRHFTPQPRYHKFRKFGRG